MKYSCLHTHTTFCDGGDEIETFCETACQKGFVSIGFSAHAPVSRKTGFQSDWHLREDRIEAYCDAVRAARRRWEGRLRIFLGLEVDYIRGLISPADPDYKNLGLDYIIGSVHYVIPPKYSPFTVDSSAEEFERGLKEGFSGNADALVNAYWDAVEAMIRDSGFDILGHADLIKKNNPQNRWFSLEGESYLRRTAGVAELIGTSPLVVEVNTGGLTRYKIPDTYPGLCMLSQLQAKNVPVIITADAHKAGHLGGYYDKAREILLEAGYAKAVLFEGRSHGNPLWTEDPL
ncbi:MAG: histidinol-phosphatase [Treponema sp.]|jgi:histidinol-phosphatase (PHP family)|nr:histidinol-phosphatase [Treponema sp.]